MMTRSLIPGYSLRLIFPVFILGLLAIGCSPSAEEKINTFPNKFADPELIKLYDYKDRRQSEALLLYLTHHNPTYREEAALAFASVQDSASLPALEQLLSDRVPVVRKAAAFAIGQLRKSASLPALAIQLSYESEPVVRYYMLEAVGKCLSDNYIPYLASYEASDPLTLSGKAWAIYQAGLAGIADTLLTSAAGILLADSLPRETRLAAAHYFSRASDISLMQWEGQLKKIAQTDPSAEVRMAAARSLAKSTDDSIAYFLRDALPAEPDLLVRTNLVRALQPTHFPVVAETITALLKSTDYQLAVATAEAIQTWEHRDLPRLLWDLRNSIPVLRTKALILGKMLQAPAYSYNAYRELVNAFEVAANPYDKGIFLQAMSGYPNASIFLAAQLKEVHPFVRTSAMEALSGMNRAPDFPAYKQGELAGYYRNAILSGDAGKVTIAAATLSDLQNKLRPFFSNLNFLYQGLDSLELPQDLEPYQALERVIQLYEEKEYTASNQLFQNPILWDVVKEISQSARAVVQTQRGTIEIELMVEEAPGSVENFVSLARGGFYENIAFHRVVPNFVIQAGCPRGDGYGSSNEIIRSEFSTEKYGTGYVGMASAGKDTEGSQWFITHSPTPHLNGAYTIFGKVVSGMDVVNRIQIGDRITSVNIQ